MSRPIKWRDVCSLPNFNHFGPLNIPKGDKDVITMTIDEYETIRLIDLERLTQEECATQMNIARTTVQGIYNRARKKLADIIVNGNILVIEGGEYRICDGDKPDCCRRRRECRNENPKKKEEE
jgi:predicted DNA-binding protein (UPF0251 family)